LASFTSTFLGINVGGLLEESDYLNDKLPDKIVLGPELVQRSSSYPKSKVTHYHFILLKQLRYVLL